MYGQFVLLEVVCKAVLSFQDLEPPEGEAEPEPEQDDEQKQKQRRKDDALKAKEQGNAAYKARKFDEAIGHYDKAYELYDEDISFLTNRSAADPPEPL